MGTPARRVRCRAVGVSAPQLHIVHRVITSARLTGSGLADAVMARQFRNPLADTPARRQQG